MRDWRKKRKVFWVFIPIIILTVTITLFLLYFNQKTNKEVEPEE